MAKHWTRYSLFSTLAAICMMNAPMPMLAQDAKPAIQKWRPKEGTYAVPGKGFAGTCGEFGDLIIGLREKDISGHEWGCKVTKLTDTGPGAIRVEMTCSDYNLAENLKKPEDTEFKEIILLKKIDETSMSARRTVDGKFKDPEFKAVYCPKEAQELFLESRAKKKAEAAQSKEQPKQ